MEISYCHTWLNNGQDYTIGVKYYEEHGSNNVLKGLFKTGPSSFNRSKLLSEILQMSKNISAAAPVIKQPVPVLKTWDNKIDLDLLPESLKTEAGKLKDLYNSIRFYNSSLSILPTNEERLECAKKISVLETERRVIFNRIDHFNLTGQDLVQVKAEPVKKETPPVAYRILELKAARKLLASQKSRLKNKPLKVEKYNKVVTELEAIDTELHGLQERTA